ncbi:MAG TPA: trehalase family glycosidase [Chthonomonadaceae bacterium]|nr:trehalase family glycosidase [Chthonomonadaceae bacterium]
MHPDPLGLLERTDKWYLGGGRAALFAPAFPRFLDTPGFWDEAYFADIRIERLFCLLLLDARGRPLTLHRATRRWTPDRLTQIYTVEGVPGLRIQEERVVTPNDTLASRLTFQHSGSRPAHLHVLLWSLQPASALPEHENAATASDVLHEPDALSFAYRLRYAGPGETPAEVYGWGERARAGTSPPSTDPASTSHSTGTDAGPPPSHALYVALGGSRMPDSWTVNLAERSDTAPLWQVSVFPEKFRQGMLAKEMQAEAGWNPNGLLHLGLHYIVELATGDTDSLTFGAALALEREEALAALRSDLAGDVVAQSRQSWMDYFAGVPQFTCSDPYLERYYWYRWYGLRLLQVDLRAGHLPYPCIFEGIGAFRSHISYSAQCHMREAAWMHDPALAMGSIENFLANQIRQEGSAEDGFLPGHLYLWRQDRGFYHANWGAAALQIYYLTGDLDFVRRIYPALARYVDYFDRERDQEQSGLYDIQDQGETGQEYMSRYLFADPGADAWRKIRIKGVDATCYLYELHRAMAVFAYDLGDPEVADVWDAKADALCEAVRERMWDPATRLFHDVNPRTGERSPYKAAVGFYPFLSDIALEEHLTALRTHLHDPTTFGTPFPVPSSSADDPYFDAEAEWKGKRTNCPWNGRVWPMTNSHIADALAQAARTLAPDLRPLAADFLMRFVRMLFHEGDPKRPNCYEHYNPQTGMPSLYRGVDDYQHSWIVDLMLRHVVGIQPEPGPNGELILDPLPFDLAHFQVEDIRIRGHRVDVSWSRSHGFQVHVDGALRLHIPERARVEVALF